MISDKLLTAVYGVGSHAKTVLSTPKTESKVQVVGVLGDNRQSRAGFSQGYQVLGGRAELAALRNKGIPHTIVAIGDISVRGELARRIPGLGLQPARAIHPSATLVRGCRIGAGTTVLPAALMGADAQVEGSVLTRLEWTERHNGLFGNLPDSFTAVGLPAHISKR